MNDFDFKPVYDEMIALYLKRTLNPTIDDLAPDYRVRWSEVFACMQKHGYKLPMVQGRIDWYNAVGKKFDKECAKINKEHFR